MFIYNVTINIESASHDEWLRWIREEHIPDVMKTGLFSGNRMLRVLGDDESGGHTYSIQYSFDTMEKYREYERVHAQTLRKASVDKFGEKFVAFRTLLEIVE